MSLGWYKVSQNSLLLHLQSVLSLLTDTERSNMSVGIVEKLKEALVDHVLCSIHEEQWQHVLPKTRDVFDVLPPICCGW